MPKLTKEPGSRVLHDLLRNDLLRVSYLKYYDIEPGRDTGTTKGMSGKRPVFRESQATTEDYNVEKTTTVDRPKAKRVVRRRRKAGE